MAAGNDFGTADGNGFAIADSNDMQELMQRNLLVLAKFTTFASGIVALVAPNMACFDPCLPEFSSGNLRRESTTQAKLGLKRYVEEIADM